MLIPSDYKELLSVLNKHRVRYLIIGAYAVIYYTEPRYTKDIDIWVDPEEENAKRVYAALREFGAPLKEITHKDFLKKTLVYQIGVAPVRADVLMGIANIEFAKAWQRRSVTSFAGIKANIIGINELIRAKENAQRRPDKIDLENLKQSMKLKKR